MTDMRLTAWSSNSADFHVSYDGKLAKLELTGIQIPPHLEEELQEDEALRIEFFRSELTRLAEELQSPKSRLRESHG
jgi:hypothetical protein